MKSKTRRHIPRRVRIFMDYQIGVREALQRVEDILLANKSHEYCHEIIAEVIFREPLPHQRHSAPKLTLTQEFQLVTGLCDHFTDRYTRTPQSPAICNTLFLTLFTSSSSSTSSSASNSSSSLRSRILGRLISTAICARLQAVLSACGTWMQQMGPTSAGSADLARHLVDDFINYSRHGRQQLRDLPQLAPRFAVNLLTAITELYLLDADQRDAPPAALLDCITGWLKASGQPGCSGAQLPPPELPAGAIAMPVVPPLAGLIRWCVLAPMFAAAGPLEATAAASRSAQQYNDLHLAVLQSLARSSKVSGTAATATAAASSAQPGINASHLAAIVTAIQRSDVRQGAATVAEAAAIALEAGERLDASLERFAQAVQLALAGRSVTGNLTQLMCRLEQLPANGLMEMVIRANRAQL